ncbi:MAG TPA: S9 family peptidase [Thermoanaerobaculia bacterium]|nr:S9 family peptidase [Thermoanaerobaculia bacterium]
MKKICLLLTVLALAGLAGFAAEPNPPRPLLPDDVYAMKTVGDPRVSPDGRFVAYTVRAFERKEDGSDTDVYMSPSPGGEPLRLTGSPKPETTPRWSPDGRYLAFLSGRDGKKTQVWLLPRAGGEAFVLTRYQADVQDLAWSPDGKRLALVVADVDPDDPDLAEEAGKDKKEKKDEPAKTPKPIVIQRRQFKRDTEGYLRELRNHLYVFDVSTRVSEQVTAGPYDDSAPAWSPDGTQLAFTSNRTADPDANQNTDLFVVAAKAGQAPRVLAASPAPEDEAAWSPDGKQVAYVVGGDVADMWYGASAIAVVPVAGGAPRPLTRELDRNVRSPRFAPDGRSVLFLVEEGGNSHLARVPLAGGTGGTGGKIERVIDGERDVTNFDFDAKGDLAVLSSEPDLPGEVFVAHLGTGTSSLTRLTHANDAFLAGIRLGKVLRYPAKSADGTPVDAFLTLPPGVDAKAGGTRLPTVLRIHGGPTSQYSTGFNFEWQVLAAHGFAVVAANPRGSTGYGTAFSRAIWADWGNKDSQDVLAAVDQAIAMGVADPDHLGIGGWSYGGILTDHVLVRTTRFKAAISGASEVNYLADYGTDQYQYEWETELGLPWKNTELWMRLSPWFQVEKVTTPTLLLCGADDMNVPLLNSEQFYQALRRLGRDTELVIYPGQHHGLTKPSYIKDRYERYIAWYDKYLRPAAVATAPAGSPR